ncbi:cytochrome c6 PetJ [Chroococcidiopsis sp. SAG 2025]|uniref:cytochrome c6 PetJ n=1 Tax=Chroococcidiopsis sp. SAG 2025 TaxID=171389 RepID=UPI003977A0EB
MLFKQIFKQTLGFVLVIFAGMAIASSVPALAADTSDAAKIFEAQCAGCHINGGNIVRRGKNLKQKALKKYGMDSLEAIANIVTNGQGNMSAYKDRLTTDEIQAVSAYVLNQAATGWRKQ